MAKKTRKAKKSSAEVAMPASDDNWQAQDDLRTIERAQKVVGDSKRLTAAKAEAKRQQESLDRIARLEGKKL